MLVCLFAVALAAASSAGSATARQQQGAAKIPAISVKIHSKTLVEITVRGSGTGWRLGLRAVANFKALAPLKVTPAVRGKMDYGTYEMFLPRLTPGKPLVIRFIYSAAATRNGVCYASRIIYKTNPPIQGGCDHK